jgi:hypothetical protein
MNTTLFLIAINAIFATLSILFQWGSVKGKAYLAFILTFAYLAFTYCLFSAAIVVHQICRDKGIYLELGHADEVLVEFLLLWAIITLINITSVVVRRNARARKDNDDK